MSLASQTIPNNVHVAGTLSCANFVAPENSIDDDAIEAGAEIAAAKLVHRQALCYYQDAASAVAAATADIYYYTATASGTVNSINAMINNAIATGGDRTVTIDLKKSTSAGAFASILSTAIVLDNTNTLRTAEAGTVSTPTLVTGDILQITVAVAGAAGAQAKGLLVVVEVEEAGV